MPSTSAAPPAANEPAHKNALERLPTGAGAGAPAASVARATVRGGSLIVGAALRETVVGRPGPGAVTPFGAFVMTRVASSSSIAGFVFGLNVECKPTGAGASGASGLGATMVVFS